MLATYPRDLPAVRALARRGLYLVEGDDGDRVVQVASSGRWTRPYVAACSCAAFRRDGECIHGHAVDEVLEGHWLQYGRHRALRNCRGRKAEQRSWHRQNR